MSKTGRLNQPLGLCTARKINAASSPPDTDRSALARSGIARQLGVGGFMLPEFAERVTPGNIEDDLGRLAFLHPDTTLELVDEIIATME